MYQVEWWNVECQARGLINPWVGEMTFSLSLCQKKKKLITSKLLGDSSGFEHRKWGFYCVSVWRALSLATHLLLFSHLYLPSNWSHFLPQVEGNFSCEAERAKIEVRVASVVKWHTRSTVRNSLLWFLLFREVCIHVRSLCEVEAEGGWRVDWKGLPIGSGKKSQAEFWLRTEFCLIQKKEAAAAAPYELSI